MSNFCEPIDYSPPGSSVHGILQARILEWVAFPSPRDHPNPGTKPRSPALQADSLPTKLIVIPKFTDRFSFNQSPGINPCTYGQLIYDKRGMTIQYWKDSFFNKWC